LPEAEVVEVVGKAAVVEQADILPMLEQPWFKELPILLQ
jgi:hypothetical protein